ncbi:hypothetical protein FXO38_21808 [Capsicum annuum]|nr:hypothetical protein FXO38_21808 [Capsicum annuum]
MAGIVGCLRVSFGVSQWFMDGIGPREKFWMKLLGRFPNGLLNRLGCFGRAGESFSKSNGRNDWNCRFFCEVLVDLCPRFKVCARAPEKVLVKYLEWCPDDL